ncbi:MAG: DinB family protein [Chloroflexi bacterium]|nr:DinB family protein [Chloroflexota bacterium]
MTFKERVFKTVAEWVVERPGRSKSYDEWKQQLNVSGAAIEARASQSNSPDRARSVLRHLTGIERWGQRRLQILLGAAPIQDNYDGYQPDADLDLAGQLAAFAQTRAATLKLVDQLKEAGVSDTLKADHNDYGQLSARGWLRYLDLHASLESKKIR